jgi:hypothetical protein
MAYPSGIFVYQSGRKKMQSDELNPRLTVPQRVYDWYNAHYDNETYHAVRAALVASAHYGPLSANQSNEDFITTLMNLLIDASFERCGAERYAGAEARLMAALDPLDSRVTTLVRLHLANFDNRDHKDAAQSPQDARQAVDAAVQVTSEIPAWRGRVAYAWASAAFYLSHAAQTILDDANADSYPLEKLDRALDHLQNGVLEAEQNGISFSDPFTAWIRALVKARR